MANSPAKFGQDFVFKVSPTGTSTASAGNVDNISRHVMSVDGLPGGREKSDVTCGGGAVAREWLVGMLTGDISLVCLFDQTTAKSAKSAWITFATASVGDTYPRFFEYAPAGETAGYPKVKGRMRVSEVVFNAKPMEPLQFNVSAALETSITVGVCT